MATSSTEVRSLSERLYALLSGDSGPLEGRCGPEHEGAGLTEFECDCQDLGMVYGLAWAMARTEDPFEPIASVTERAVAAASLAFIRWGGDDVFTGEAYRKDRAARPVPAEAVA